MQPNFGLLDTQAPERISRNVLAIQEQGENQEMNRLKLQSDMEDRQMRNALAQQGLQQRRQEHSMAMIPKIAQLLYADPSDNTIDALAQVYSEATGQDVSQFAGQLKQMPPEQRRQVALAMGQKYDPKFQAFNLGDRYQGGMVGPDGIIPVGPSLPIADKPDAGPRINNPTVIKGRDGAGKYWDGSKWVDISEDGKPFVLADTDPESKRNLSQAAAEGKANVERQEESLKGKKKAFSLITALEQARGILTKKNDDGTETPGNVTASGAGALADEVTDFFGVGTEAKDNSAKLETISGWMVSNVPRMEGPQSNLDVDNYKIMAGRVGDRKQPISARLAALKELEKLQKKYAHLNEQFEEPPKGKGGKPSLDDIFK